MHSILFNFKRRWVFYYNAKMFYVMILDLLSQFAVSTTKNVECLQ